VSPTHAALIVAVPAAEEAVAALRARLDRSASWGVPAHVTVLFPFLAPALIDDDVLNAVRETVVSVPRFDLALTGTAWFRDQVLWLRPEPDAPLRALTIALCRRFPQVRPYGGEIGLDDIVPHLTVGHEHPRAVLDAAAAEVEAHLPIRTHVGAVRLIAGRREPGGSWPTLAEFPLSSRS
jgi:2'-5' RNA ligase